MDYKRVKSGREKGLVWLALIFDCCNIGSMRYEYSAYCFKPSDKSYVCEALQGQLTMQEETIL